MRRSAIGIALLVMTLVTLGAAIFLRSMSPAAAGARADMPVGLLALEDGATGEGPTGISIQVDTPPKQPVAAAGWPFQQLPLVAKFGVITPRVRPIPPIAFAPVPIPPRPFVPQPPVPDVPVRPSPWLLAPLAGGAFIGGRDGPAPPPEVIPEPSTVILLSTGMLLLGIGAWFSRV
ncbi:MAG TPA: hypothetical protein VK912_19130 [Longimicrobiales bacterium]|nr:hypothetical protein [Longimicrobiales bacterium]